MTDDVPRLRSRPWTAIIVGGVTVAVVAGLGIALLAARPGMPEASAELRERAAYTRPMPPPHADAYRTGGVPLRDAAVEALLVELADTSVKETPLALGPAPFTGGLAEAWKRLLAAWDGWLVRDAIDVRAELAELTDAAPAPADTTDESGAASPDDLAIGDEVASSAAEKELRTAVRAFDDALATAGLGYFIEARIRVRHGHARAFLRAFRVEEVTILHAAGRAYPIPNLHQIDHVSVRHSAMGLESPDLGAIVIVDPIARYAMTEVMPVLAANGAFGLGTKSWRATVPGERIGKIVGEVVRRELTAALGRDAEVARTIGGHLARRAALVDKWRVILRKRDGVFLPSDELARIADKVPAAEHAEVVAIEDDLARLEAPRIASLVTQLVATSVRRHELAHLLDRARPTPLPVPRLLEEVTGKTDAARLVHARAELVGYLSQLIDDPVTPHLSLWGAAAAAFEGNRTAEGRAGTVILMGLAHEAGISVEQRADEPQRTYLARLAEALAKIDGAELRRLAIAVWQGLYDEAHIPVTDRP